MLRKCVPFLLAVVVFAACSKDKLETKPTIELKSLNGTEFVFDPMLGVPDLIMTFEFRDKEGDLGGGTVTYIRNRTNADPISNPAANDKIDTVRAPLPNFPKSTTGEFEIKFPGPFLIEDPDDNDTMFFKVLVQDVAGNVSDTVVTPTVVQRKQ